MWCKSDSKFFSTYNLWCREIYGRASRRADEGPNSLGHQRSLVYVVRQDTELETFGIRRFCTRVATGGGSAIVGSCSREPGSASGRVFLIIYPLNFLGGDLNPYSFHKPTLHFYLLGLIYLARFFSASLGGLQWDLSQYVAYHYFWDNASLLVWARVVGVAFGVGTVWCVSRLAHCLYGARAGVVAGLLLAVSVLHVRQSPLAAVDIPMAFWFVCAVWAAVRLFQDGRLSHYLLAGSLVGLAAGTKYPGAAVSMTIVCAHLLSGRRLWDKRLWLSGVAAVVVFLLSTPYAALDFEAFSTHLLFQAQHVQGGRGEHGPAWLYHLGTSLRHNIGILGLFAFASALVLQSVRQRKGEVWIAICGFASFLIAVGWGQLAFMRYALPLAALQVVLVSGLVASIKTTRWQVLLTAVIAAGPLYGSLRVGQLLSSTDTRTEAALWIEKNIEAGSTCCNFGGWAGDPPARTFADHWWRMTTYERSFGRHQMDRQIEFLTTHKPDRPVFWYAVHMGNREVSEGSLAILNEMGCAFVILHRHPLAYSTVDSSFAEQLPGYGRLVAQWTPTGLESADPKFDPADAFYVPVSGFGSLGQAGPAIEIFEVERFSSGLSGAQSGNSIFSKGYALWAKRMLADGEIAEALELIQRATALAENEVDTQSARILIMAIAEYLHGHDRRAEALEICHEVVKKWPDWYRAYDVMGAWYDEAGDHLAAVSAYGRSLGLNPNRSMIHYSIAVAHEELGNRDEAVKHWERALALDPDNPATLYNLGTAYRLRGENERALRYLERATALAPRKRKGAR